MGNNNRGYWAGLDGVTPGQLIADHAAICQDAADGVVNLAVGPADVFVNQGPLGTGLHFFIRIRATVLAEAYIVRQQGAGRVSWVACGHNGV